MLANRKKGWSGANYMTAATIATVLVLLALSTLLGAMFFSSATWDSWKDSATTASWAQTFSSVAAILVGAGAIFWQVRRQGFEREMERKAAEARVLNTIQQELFGCRVALEHLYADVMGADGRRIRQIERGIARLRELRISDIADWRVHLAIRHLAEFIEANQLKSHKSMDTLRDIMVNAETRLQDALQERGFELLPLKGHFDEVFRSRRYLVKTGDLGQAADAGPTSPDT